MVQFLAHCIALLYCYHRYFVLLCCKGVDRIRWAELFFQVLVVIHVTWICIFFCQIFTQEVCK